MIQLQREKMSEKVSLEGREGAGGGVQRVAIGKSLELCPFFFVKPSFH